MSHSDKRERIVTAENIIDLLDFRGKENPNKIVYQYLKNGEVLDASLTFSELHQQVKALAGLIQKRCRLGDRVLLLYPSGLDYIVAFFACLYAGVIAVPAYPPQNQRRGWDRLQNMIVDCDPSLVLSSEPYEQSITQWIDSQTESHQLQILISDRLDFRDVSFQAMWVRPDISSETIAFLQYSSGSTGKPKGVMVSHGNLLHNLHVIQQSCNLNQDFHIIGWLPIYHDMGLIGNVISAVYIGGTLTLLSPVDVIQKPLRWLKAISDYRAAASGGPNFIYDLCIQQITEEQKAQLDLSSWRVAFNGAEPINGDTMLRFSKAFSPCGLSDKALLPCYGLAENTLMVSSKHSDDSLSVLTVNAKELKQHRAKVVNQNQESTESMVLVSSGNCITDQEVCIVHPNTLAQCLDNQVGEIWVRGESVAKGYWGKPELSNAVFQAHISGDSAKSYLRTGDYGFLHNSHLYVTGRIKELIIIRGQNHYPQDIEASVQGSSDYFRRSGGAAFSIDINGEERLVVVQELTRQGLRIKDSVKIAEIFYQVQLNVTQYHQLKLHDIVLVKPGSLSKTTSGKNQRFLNRERYLTLQFEVHHSLLGTQQASSQIQVAYVAPSSDVEMVLCQIWQDLLTIESVGIDDNFFQLGGDSLLATRMIGQVNQYFSLEVRLKTLFELPTIRAFAKIICNSNSIKAGAFSVPPVVPLVSVLKSSGQQLKPSFAQQRLWLLDQIDNGSTHYHISGALKLSGVLNYDAIVYALNTIVERHQSLRTCFIVGTNGEPQQLIQPACEFKLEKKDLSLGSTVTRAQTINEQLRQEATHPFDLSRDLMLRARLLKVSDEEHVLAITLHHIAADGWSMTIFVKEFCAFYRAFIQNKTVLLPNQTIPLPSYLSPLDIQYADYAQWQHKYLNGEVLNQKMGYWETQLIDLPIVHNLPLDYPRPVIQSFKGTLHHSEIKAETTRRLQTLCSQQSATLFMGLHAIFSVLLARYSNEKDIVVGTPIANREQVELADLIGFFVNTLVLRSDLSSSPSFSQLLDQSKSTLLSSYEHQQAPFEQLVNRLQPERSTAHNPLCQVMLSLQNNEQRPLSLPELTLEMLAPVSTIAKYDLALDISETKQGLSLTWEYNIDLFKAETVARMAVHFERLLTELTMNPEQNVFTVAMLSEHERKQELNAWNVSSIELPGYGCIHQGFEQQVERTPDATALVFEQQRLSYRELNNQANQLSHYLLQHHSLKADDRVGVYLQRSPNMIVSILGILKAGAAYVPLDPDYPAERVRYISGDADLSLVLTTKDIRQTCSVENISIVCVDDSTLALGSYDYCNPDSEKLGLSTTSLAYVIYTSGSTGNPKGVMVEHRALVNQIDWINTTYGANADDRFLLKSPFGFDISLCEFIWPLMVGARLVIAKPHGQKDPEYLCELIQSQKISKIQIVPSMLAGMLSYGDLSSCHSLQQVFCGGETLPKELVEKLQSRCPWLHVYNLYGPTEATIIAAHWSCPQLDKSHALTRIPIGKAVQNLQLYVLDEHLQPVPQGVVGELYIGGVGLARGYINRDDLTEAVFIVNPFYCTDNPMSSERLYKTGDLVRRLSDGNLDYIGRSDFQVKLRGLRIELGEIENALTRLALVREVVVAMTGSEKSDQRIVAYLVMEKDTSQKGSVYEGIATEDFTDNIRGELAESLPEYMLPSAIVILDFIPLTANGKVDRKALPKVEHIKQGHYVAPGNSNEKVLCEVWQGVLGLERVGIHDNFFELGGHSLLATNLVSRIRQSLEIDLPLSTLFSAQTPKKLAAAISHLDKGRQLPPLIPMSHADKLLLSFTQQRLWLLDQIDEGSTHYNVPGSLRLSGVLNVDALSYALRTILERHQSLRTCFISDTNGEPEQLIQSVFEFKIKQHDLSFVLPQNRDQEIVEHLQEEASRPFDLRRDLMLRALLLKVTDKEHILGITLHHIAADGWSIAILVKELCALYRAYMQDQTAPSEIPLAALDIQYVDYAQWQRSCLQGEALDQQLDYWKTQLSNLPVAHNLPLDYPRPPVQSFNGALHRSDIRVDSTQRLQALCDQQGATLFMGLHAVFSVLLARYSNEHDIVVGTPIANREQAEVAGLIGFFVNTLVLRSDLSSAPNFNQLLAQSKSTLLDSYDHQQAPFEQLLDLLQPERSTAHGPLFQVMLSLQNNEQEPLSLPELTLEMLEPVSTVAKCDLTLELTETKQGLSLSWEYNTDLFKASTIAQMAAHFEQLLIELTTNPQQNVFTVAMLNEQERHQQLFDWNNSQRDFDLSQDMVTRFEQQVERTPKAVAVEFGSSRLNYRELNQLANQLAHYLINQGLLDANVLGQNTECNRLIALSLDRDVYMLACMLAVQKVGLAYLPIDPTYPKARQQYILNHAKPIFTLTPTVLADILPHLDTYPITNVMVERSPEQLAYTLYTSGSTGNPKGVQISHGAFINFLLAMAEHVPLSSGQRWLAITTIAFDISGLELFLPLISGASVVLASREQTQDPQQLLALIDKNIDVMQATPATWRMLLDYSDAAWPELYALCGGEALSMELANQLLARKVNLLNLYGPTETTVWSTFQPITQALNKPASIGRPLGNNQCFVLNNYRQLVPVGVPGELYIGGQGLARGYLKREDLNDKAFIENPFLQSDTSFSARLYRTGDRVCYRPDGRLEYLGRNDFQVKIRGFRIELGEIENVLAAQDVVSEAIVDMQTSDNGEAILVAYVTLKCSLQEGWQSEMRRVVGRALPAYMLPSAFVSLEQLPLTPNGKVDRKSLPKVELSHLQNVYIAPENQTETTLCDICQDILQVERIGMTDNFFMLGGNSLLAVKLVSRIEEAFQIDLALSHLFDATSIADLVIVIDNSEKKMTEDIFDRMSDLLEELEA